VPARAQAAVRQKTRWIQGIALQGWDRLGWSGSPVQMWMQLRDRRGPFAAILLALAYLLVAFAGVSWSASTAGLIEPIRFTPLLTALLIANFCALLWRAGLRMVFTAREFGWVEGLLALPRIFVSNWIAILAGRRALTGYIRSLRGAPAIWDKTEHFDHPALAYPRGARA
ncbi:MAG: glycosyl transferase family protein, partial [Qipengyuania sp.]